MKFFQKVLNKLNGLHYRQEYLCMAKESFDFPLHTFITNGDQIVQDISNAHLFTGYSPLIYTLYAPINKSGYLRDTIEISLSQKAFLPNEFLPKKDAIALLKLRKIGEWMTADTKICHYEGQEGKHRFLGPFYQYIIGLSNKLYSPKTGNVFLPNDLYKQVQIAYALPRIISLITVSDGREFNLFPTDLHGPVEDQYYVCSLRHQGKACQQVVASRRIVVSRVHSGFYKTVYALGKNHMKGLGPAPDYPFSDQLSASFQLPVPQQVLRYQELEMMDSVDHGIHKLMLFKVRNSQVTSIEPTTLAHVHQVYATWRLKRGLPGNYLMR